MSYQVRISWLWVVMKQITALFWFCRKCCNRPLLPIKGAKKLPNLKSHIYQDPRKIQVDKMTVSSVPHSSLLQQVWTIFYIGGKKPNLKAAIWLNSVFFCHPCFAGLYEFQWQWCLCDTVPPDLCVQPHHLPAGAQPQCQVHLRGFLCQEVPT